MTHWKNYKLFICIFWMRTYGYTWLITCYKNKKAATSIGDFLFPHLVALLRIVGLICSQYSYNHNAHDEECQKAVWGKASRVVWWGVMKVKTTTHEGVVVLNFIKTHTFCFNSDPNKLQNSRWLGKKPLFNQIRAHSSLGSTIHLITSYILCKIIL